MATYATPTLTRLAAAWRGLYPSAKFSGIVGDLSHLERGGYHISIKDNPAGNYSIVRADDKAPPGDWPRDAAAAIDMNLALEDMKLCHARLKKVFANRATDTRAQYINAWNGWDGNGSPGRYDMVTGAVSAATKDHEWHCHLEVRRRYVNDDAAAYAILSILKGESHDDYLETFVTLTNADMAKLKAELVPEIVNQVWAKDIDTSDGKYSAGGAVLDSNRRDNYLANQWADEVDVSLGELGAALLEIDKKLALLLPPPTDPPPAE